MGLVDVCDCIYDAEVAESANMECRFRDFDNTKSLPLAVRGSFDNGGTFVYVAGIATKIDDNKLI